MWCIGWFTEAPTTSAWLCFNIGGSQQIIKCQGRRLNMRYKINWLPKPVATHIRDLVNLKPKSQLISYYVSAKTFLGVTTKSMVNHGKFPTGNTKRRSWSTFKTNTTSQVGKPHFRKKPSIEKGFKTPSTFSHVKHCLLLSWFDLVSREKYLVLMSWHH